ncbi:cullin-4A [Trichonephila clavipes]|nr:cullin-4A [Trichonephila clavipes]
MDPQTTVSGKCPSSPEDEQGKPGEKNNYQLSLIRYSRLATLTADLASNPGEDMDVCKRIAPAWHESTLNSRRAASPLVRLVEGEERWEAPDHPQGVLPQNWSETELNHSVTCMVFKATTNDRHHLALCHNEFRGS